MASKQLNREKQLYSWDDFLFLKKRMKVDQVLKIQIVSDSMSPLIKIGQKLEIIALPTESMVKKYDILVFWQANKLNCHIFWEWRQDIRNQKLLGISKSMKEPKGEDFPWDFEQVLGIVRDVEVSFFTKLKINILNKRLFFGKN